MPFFRYESVLKVVENPDSSTYAEKAAAEQLVRSSFAQLDVYLSSRLINVMQDTPSANWMATFSQIAACLNLWSGLTVVLVIEFADFLVRLILHRTDDGDSDNTEPCETCNGYGEQARKPARRMTIQVTTPMYGSIQE